MDLASIHPIKAGSKVDRNQIFCHQNEFLTNFFLIFPLSSWADCGSLTAHLLPLVVFLSTRILQQLAQWYRAGKSFPHDKDIKIRIRDWSSLPLSC